MIIFVNGYWESEKKETLKENAHEVTSLIEYTAVYNAYTKTLTIEDLELFRIAVSSISQSMDTKIFIVNTKGQLVYCSEQGQECVHSDKVLPSQILGEAAATGEYFERGKLNGYLDDPSYVVGLPIKVTSEDANVIVGFCFVSYSSSFVADFTVNFLKMFLLASVITFVFVLILDGLFTYSIVKPLRQMSAAAKRFAVGDFSQRVPVRSDDQVGDLAKAFNEMADSLSASEGMRRSFIANVSHELKTPMTTIAGFIDGILDGTIKKEEQKKYLTIVSSEVKRLSRLVTSMLSLSRIDNGELKLSKQHFNISGTIISILIGFEEGITKKGITVEGIDSFEELKVYADPDLLYQVVYNLVENAVKFTNDGGKIEFSYRLENNTYYFTIKNSGQGIPPEDIHYIFDRFYKTDKSRSMDKKGMGLGLFIAKTIMRMHGGDITVASVVNDFTAFTFNLPKEETMQLTNKRFINTTVQSKEN